MKKYKDSVGKVYLYLFSMLGLVLVVIGTSGLINLGLKTWVFNTEDPWMAQPPMPYWSEKVEIITSCENFTAEERALASQWLLDYESWEKDSGARYNKYNNNEAAARNLALLLVGLPLFLFHWRLVRRNQD